MYRIAKRFTFAASHVLHGLPEGHKCGRLHGHNYVVEIVLGCSQPDATGFVEDYGSLSDIKEFIATNLDHRHLNDVVLFQPSAENLAYWLYRAVKPRHPLTVAVRVCETVDTWAEYTDE